MYGFALLGFPCNESVSKQVHKLELLHEELAKPTAELEAILKEKDAAIQAQEYLEAKDLQSKQDRIEDELRKTRDELAQLKISTEKLAESWCLHGNAGKGLSSAAVRSWYNTHLNAMTEKLQAYRQLEPSAAQAMLGGFQQPCELTGLAVRARMAIKTKARIQGSSTMHAALIVRDWFVYGFFNEFGLKSLMDRKRSKMQKEGLSPSQEEVCEAVLTSSFRSNPDWTELAKTAGEAGITYQSEIVSIYGGMVVITIVASALLAILWRCATCCASKIKCLVLKNKSN